MNTVIKPIFVLISILLLSCESDFSNSLTEHNELIISDGMLAFTNEEELFLYAKTELINDNINVRYSGKSEKFKSFMDLYYEASDKLSIVVSEDEHNNLLKEYEDVLYLQDSVYKPTISNIFYGKICNRDRMYSVGNYVFKVFDNQFILATEMKNYARLKNVKKESDIDPVFFKKVAYVINSTESKEQRIETSCVNSYSVDYFYNRSNCKDDRRVWIDAVAYFAITGYVNFNPKQYPMVSISISGSKRNRFCNWSPYATTLSNGPSRFGLMTYLNTSINPLYTTSQRVYVGQSFPATSSPGDAYSLTLFFDTTGDYVLAEPVGIYNFSVLHVEATSRGVNGNWAVVDCE